MWTLQKLKGKESPMNIGGNGEVMKKKLVREETSRRGHLDQSGLEEECWSVDERVVTSTRSLHRREWGWTEGEMGVGLDQPGHWIKHQSVGLYQPGSWIKRFEDPFEKTQWREVKHVQAGVGSNQPDRCWINKAVGPNQPGRWIKHGHGPPMLSYLSISPGESWRERGAN